MRDNIQSHTDTQSICSSSVGDAPSLTTMSSRGGANITPLASSTNTAMAAATAGGGGGGNIGSSSNNNAGAVLGGSNSSSSSAAHQHPQPFQNQQPAAVTASQYNYNNISSSSNRNSSNVGAPASTASAVAVQQHQHPHAGLSSNSFAASSVSSSLAIGSPVGGSFVGLPGTNNLIGGSVGGENFFVRGGYHPLYGGSSSFALTTNATSTATAAPSVAGAAAPSPYCCECSTAQNRCSTDLCPCFASRRMCDEHCESARYRGDCLNQAICKCSCEADPSKPAKNVCTKSERCDCLRIKEGCSKLCACKQICKNKEPTKKIAKINKPAQGCQCAKSKKQCVKKECPCRSVYEFCSSSCKCSGDCTNGPSKFHVPKHVQNCFLEHKHESSGLIVTLIGEDYIYRGDFYHESKSEPHVEEQLVAAIYDLISKYKIDLYEIVIFVSKSPCFHQDCDPKCEVVDECKSNKACAKLLGLLLSKVRKELSKVDVKMTVKFLYPHLNRGDLYTKQGILSMLQAGIKVEPLLMKDWSAVMDWSPHADHKGEYLQLWNNHNLDKSVAQSQSFINECRRALGLSMKFWVAEIHEIVKNTILHYSEIRVKCGDLNDALKQLDLTATPHKIRSTPSKRRSFIDMHELRDKLLLRGSSETRNKNGSNMSVASDDAHAQAMVASFCGRSFDDNETNEIAQRIRRATANINMEIETLLEFLTRKSTVT